MTNLKNLSVSQQKTVAYTAIGETLEACWPRLLGVILGSLGELTTDQDPLDLGPVLPGLPRTYLVEVELTEPELVILLACGATTDPVPDLLDECPALDYLSVPERAVALAGLRRKGVMVRAMVAGEVRYSVTTLGKGLYDEVMMMGVAPELVRFIDVL